MNEGNGGDKPGIDISSIAEKLRTAPMLNPHGQRCSSCEAYLPSLERDPKNPKHQGVCRRQIFGAMLVTGATPQGAPIYTPQGFYAPCFASSWCMQWKERVIAPASEAVTQHDDAAQH